MGFYMVEIERYADGLCRYLKVWADGEGAARISVAAHMLPRGWRIMRAARANG